MPGHDLHSLPDRPKRFADGCHYRLVPVHVIGHDPFDVESLVGRMVWSDYERAGAIVMSGVAAIEIACWDIMGKALGEPVHRLLGGAVRDHVKAYANGWYTVERTRQDFHAAARKVIECGYRALKLDPFPAMLGDLDREARLHAISLVEAVRDYFKILEHFNDFDDAGIKACAPGNPEVVDGYFALPTGTGLGVTVDNGVIRAHPPRQIHFDLFAEDWQLRRAERSVATD